jgi:hypothetical protein
MNVTSRSDYIRDRLTRYWLEGAGAAVSPMPREDWDLVLDELGPYARYGIAWPMPFDNPALCIPLQVELIADTTSELNDEDLSIFLDLVEILGDIQISHQCDGLSPEEALAKAEAEMDETFAASIELFQRTQFAALDRWAAR